MNLTEAIHARRAVRAYTSRPVDDSTMRMLLDAAVQAPSAMNAQPWVFAIVQDPKLLARFSDRAKKLGLERAAHDPKAAHYRALLEDPSFDIFYDAGTLVVIGTRERGPFTEADCWLAAQNFMLAARDAGLGTCPIGFAIPLLDTSEVKAELGIPRGGAAVAAIIVGYPRAVPAPVPRKPPAIVSWARPA